MTSETFNRKGRKASFRGNSSAGCPLARYYSGMFRRSVMAFSFAALLLSGELQAAPAARGGITSQPAKLVPGSPVLFRISASKKIQEASGHWFGHEVTFFRAKDVSG